MENEGGHTGPEVDHCRGDGPEMSSRDFRYEGGDYGESVTELKAAPERLQSTQSEVDARTVNVASHQEKVGVPTRLNVASIQNRVNQNQSHIRRDYRPLGLSTPWAVDLKANLPQVGLTEDYDQIRMNRSFDSIPPPQYSPEKTEVLRPSAYSANCTPIKAAGKPTQRDSVPKTMPQMGKKQHPLKHLSLDYTTPWATNRQDVLQAKARAKKLKARTEGAHNRKPEGEASEGMSRRKSLESAEDQTANYHQSMYPHHSKEHGTKNVSDHRTHETDAPDYEYQQQHYTPEAQHYTPEPPNYKEIIASLQTNYQDRLSRLNRMPLCKDTLRLRQERRDLELQLSTLEDQIRYASRLESLEQKE